MKANELRVGNYYNHNGEAKVITPNVIREAWDAERIWCKPLPLTEEWLIKFGFELEKRGYDFYYSKGIVHCCNDKDKLYFDVVQGTIEVKYVHQLQNLYFALIGEELTIK